MNAPTYHYDATGERIEDEETLDPTSSHERNHADISVVPPTRDEIHRDRCAELRRILAESRARREAQQ
jgi:hypothetical protein